MSDLIRRSDAIASWKKHQPYMATHGMWEHLDELKYLPAVDAVEVVWCRNCKWAVFTSEGKPYGCTYLPTKKGCLHPINGDFYCAYGARMDGRREDGDT